MNDFDRKIPPPIREQDGNMAEGMFRKESPQEIDKEIFKNSERRRENNLMDRDEPEKSEAEWRIHSQISKPVNPRNIEETKEIHQGPPNLQNPKNHLDSQNFEENPEK